MIYLTRLPSHGRHLGHYLRSLKTTRDVPIVSVDGKEEAIEKARGNVPDAMFTTSETLVGVLAKLPKSGDSA